ncbi:MAG: 1-acyl-sn-glycerol-3-phosphate acyltransferase [Planctomycetota bacterium]|nr:1-acyl-sn-glycerol-3-phosphate acyltransferase [Planctomycetota bacterium]
MDSSWMQTVRCILRCHQFLSDTGFAAGRSTSAMHNIVVDQPYQFVSPYRGNLLPRLLGRILIPRLLRNQYGVSANEVHGADKIRASIDAGDGILITPNHPRPCDPMALYPLAHATRSLFFVMASWHLFMEGRLQRAIVRLMGAFSIYREGMDRASLQCAMDILENARRPLVIFPEGAVTRTNDLLNPLMEGISTIARGAARKRAAGDGGKVVIFPLAIRYHFDGNLTETLEPVLAEIEQRLSWPPQHDLDLLTRIRKVGGALLGLKEIQYLGQTQSGDLWERAEKLIDRLLHPLEEEWLDGPQSGSVVKRGKNLRSVILKGMVSGDIDDVERDRRWQQFAALSLAQQLSLYPRGYLSPEAAAERFVETVERFEEDLTGLARPHPPQRVTMQVCDGIEVPAEKVRGDDPLMGQVATSLSIALGLAPE